MKRFKALPVRSDNDQAQLLCRIAEILAHAKSGPLTVTEQAEAAIYSDLLLCEARKIVGENAPISEFEVVRDEHAEVNNAATL